MSRATRIAKVEPAAYRILAMTEHDLVEVVEIEETTGLSRWGWEGYHGDLGKPNAVMLVARFERRAVALSAGESLGGFVAARVTVGELHINNLAVRRPWRRHGLGGALLRAALLRGAQIDARTAVLEVRATNLAAQTLYRRYGFRIEGRRVNYYRDPPEDALVMRAPLHPLA